MTVRGRRIGCGRRLALALGAAALLAACGGGGDELVLAGSLEARTIEVGSLVGGRVERVAVDEGAEVAAGELLVELEPDLLERELEAARGRVSAADARRAAAAAALAESEAGPRQEAVQRARIEWEAAKVDLSRIEALFGEGVVSNAAYDIARVREATAGESFREAERGTRPEQIAAARAERDAAAAAADAERGELARIERELAELRIAAPVAGRIESIDLRPGDLVAPNQPVAVLLEPGELWVRVYVPEPSLGRVAIGQAARVRVDTFPGRDFPGRVVEIRHQAEYLPRNVQTLDQRSDQVFAVKVALERADDLRPGMAAFVTLVESTDAGPERSSPEGSG
jgi:multidrug resistance efflux pump